MASTAGQRKKSSTAKSQEPPPKKSKVDGGKSNTPPLSPGEQGKKDKENDKGSELDEDRHTIENFDEFLGTLGVDDRRKMEKKLLNMMKEEVRANKALDREDGECFEVDPPAKGADTILSSLLKTVTKNDDVGQAISENLTKTCAELAEGKFNFVALDEVRKEFPRAENNEVMKVPKLPAKVKELLSKEHKDNDKLLVRAQEYLITAVNIVLSNMDLTQEIMGEEKDDPAATVFTTLSKALVVMMKSLSDITRARREVLKVDTNPELKDLFDEEKNPPTPDCLAGGDVATKIENLRKANKMFGFLKKGGTDEEKGGRKGGNRPFHNKRGGYKNFGNRGGFDNSTRGRGRGGFGKRGHHNNSNYNAQSSTRGGASTSGFQQKGSQ